MMTPELERVLALPSIKQRTPEWYRARHDLITASACADALGKNPFDSSASEKLMRNKASPPVVETPVGNEYTTHGTVFEPIATKVYEAIFSDTVYETGLIVHPRLPFIGASPDGLCASGKMLEIKCPLRRKIKKTPKGACPPHYWIQVQVQLEVCDMSSCNFWQCSFREVQAFSEWWGWAPESLDLLVAPGRPWTGLRKGIFVKDAQGNALYPDSHLASAEDYCVWTVSKLGVGDRIVYWVLEDCWNTVVERDRAWFEGEGVVKLQHFWDQVLAMRAAGGPPPLSFY